MHTNRMTESFEIESRSLLGEKENIPLSLTFFYTYQVILYGRISNFFYRFCITYVIPYDIIFSVIIVLSYS